MAERGYGEGEKKKREKERGRERKTDIGGVFRTVPSKTIGRSIPLFLLRTGEIWVLDPKMNMRQKFINTACIS